MASPYGVKRGPEMFAELEEKTKDTAEAGASKDTDAAGDAPLPAMTAPSPGPMDHDRDKSVIEKYGARRSSGMSADQRKDAEDTMAAFRGLFNRGRK